MTTVGRITQLSADGDRRVRAALIDSTELAGVMIPAAEYEKLYEWMREPDYVENASLEWLTGWINRRPSLRPL